MFQCRLPAHLLHFLRCPRYCSLPGLLRSSPSEAVRSVVGHLSASWSNLDAETKVLEANERLQLVDSYLQAGYML